MQLKYELIEDRFEETTQMRTMTEQAMMTDGTWLIRTVMYTPYLITADVSQVSVADDSKKQKQSKKKKKKGKKKWKNQPKKSSLFDPVA